MPLARYAWSRLNKQQVGAYAEYFVKMEMTMYGFQVYDTEVDDRGIDFVARHERGPFLEIQVKSLRGYGYVFMHKSKFRPSDNLYLAFAMLFEGKAPDLYLVPSTAWNAPDALFASRDYIGLSSPPEWGLNMSARNMKLLEPFRLLDTVTKLAEASSPVLPDQSPDVSN